MKTRDVGGNSRYSTSSSTSTTLCEKSDIKGHSFIKSYEHNINSILPIRGKNGGRSGTNTWQGLRSTDIKEISQNTATARHGTK
jgi:hypothetical protein